MSIFFYYNNQYYKEGEKIIQPSNPGFRFGDGLFETIKMVKGRLLLSEFHFERLFSGMKTLEFDLPDYFTKEFFENKIFELAKKNQHNNITRIRLTVFHGDEKLNNIHERNPEFIIQSYDIKSDEMNVEGLSIDIYPYVKKTFDILSSIKSNNFLPYSLAASYAKKNQLNDVILLNNFERLADSSISNIFLIKDEKIHTPSLSEGCIAGTVRRWIIEKYKDYPVFENPLMIDDLINADEVFLTNSISLLRWVKQFRNVTYKNNVSKEVYKFLRTTI